MKAGNSHFTSEYLESVSCVVYTRWYRTWTWCAVYCLRARTITASWV